MGNGQTPLPDTTDLETLTDPVEAARAAGLVYTTADDPGITRKRWGRGFTYLKPGGERVEPGPQRDRIEALAIPPAWTDVWISPDPCGHILATGRDDAGRKQYIYHPDWRAVRDRTKFNRMIAFGRALPTIRERTNADLRRHGLPREKVLGAVVRLLEDTLIRVGNPEYAADNGSFGLTTLRDRHVKVTTRSVHFEFQGKGGKKHEIDLQDRRLARVVKACRDLPGYELFQYLDADGRRVAITSTDVNDYLRAITGEDFTAKDFRTWGATRLALATLLDAGTPGEDDDIPAIIRAAVQQAADHLGNTVSVCREYYIHPGVLERYEAGRLCDSFDAAQGAAAADDDEAVVAFLVDCWLDW